MKARDDIAQAAKQIRRLASSDMCTAARRALNTSKQLSLRLKIKLRAPVRRCFLRAKRTRR